MPDIHTGNINYDPEITYEMLPRDNLKIKLLTQNMFMLPMIPNPNTMMLPIMKDYRLLEFCRNIMPQYDVICLCEVFHSWFFDGRKNLIRDISQKAGFSFSSRSPAPVYTNGRHLTDGGLLTLSRFPIVDSEFRPYSDGVLSDQIADKGVLYTQI
jgi:hypothetical protein